MSSCRTCAFWQGRENSQHGKCAETSRLPVVSQPLLTHEEFRCPRYQYRDAVGRDGQ